MSRICYLGLLIMFTLQVAANCLTPLWAIYTNLIGGDVRDAGIAILIFTWGTAIFAIAIPLLNKKQKVSSYILLITGIVVDLFAVILYFFTKDVFALYIIQVILALGAGMQIPPFYFIYERNIKTGNNSIAWGAIDSALYFAIGAGSCISAYLLYHSGIYSVFLLMISLIILALIFSVIFIKLDSMANKNN